MEQQEKSHSLLTGMQNGTATLEHGLAVSYKTKYTFTMQIQQLHSFVFTQMN